MIGLIASVLASLPAWGLSAILDGHVSQGTDMVLGFIDQASIMSYAPLWSRTRQTVPVHLSFYPVRNGDSPITQYLVIHHF